jgi:UDP-glucose 6-dehydrogenase
MPVAIAGAGYISHIHARSLRAVGHEWVMVSDVDAAVALFLPEAVERGFG